MLADAPAILSTNAMPTIACERVVELVDEAATNAFGERFAHALRAWRRQRISSAAGVGLHVQLSGDLGTGKTTLVRAALRTLGHAGRVRSPTYTLVEPYTLAMDDQAALHVYHFDLYRFADPIEWLDAGFREYFDGDALCLVEWPEKAGDLLGVPDLNINLELHGEGRRVAARAYTDAGAQCLLCLDIA